MLRKTGAFALVLLLAACGGGDSMDDEATMPEGMGLPDEDVRAILALDRAYQDAMAAGDYEALGALYTSDAVVMPAGAERIEGADAIVANLQEMGPPNGMAGFNTDTDVIHGDATIGYHRGAWRAGEGDAMMEGNYLWVLRRTPSGEWKIVSEMYTIHGAEDGM